MLQLKPISLGRELDLSLRSLSQEKSRQKSSFIDRNRVDTVKPTEFDKDKDKEATAKPVGCNKEQP